MRPCALAFLFVSLVSLSLALAACDTSEPEKGGASTFAPEDEFARRITGVVLRGSEPVEGALVQVDPSSGFGTDSLLDPRPAARATSTDGGGRYRVQFAPLRYDLFTRHDQEAFIVRDVTSRGYDLQLGHDLPVRGFSTRILPASDPPPAPGHALAFFVSGLDARTVRPVLGATDGALEVIFRRFQSTVKLHAVEYDPNLGLAAAFAEGSIDLVVREDTVSAPVVPIKPVTDTSEIVFDASPPSGYQLAPLEVLVDYALATSSHVVARVSPGTPLRMGLLGARYSVRARAAGNGASSDSGQVAFDPKAGRVVLPLPPPLSAEAPIDDTLPPPADVTLDVGGVLAARIREGIVEHILRPVSGNGVVVRIATSARATTLPDVTRLGLAHPSGAYLWTMDHFPGMTSTDKLSGEEARRFNRSSRSVSRLVTLR